MIVPAMYWSASAAPIQGARISRKETQAIAAIEKGLTSQLTRRVTSSTVGRVPTRRTDARSTFIIIGTIMSQISAAIGRLIRLSSPISSDRSVETVPGSHTPRATPATMQNPTQRVRYRSNGSSRFFRGVVGTAGMAMSMGLLLLSPVTSSGASVPG